MKQKPDEFPDQWVRQALSQLPDPPPPGSSFNSERLWGQLHAELEQTTTRRLAGWMWWVAAACFAGLVLGWFGLQQPTRGIVEVAAHTSKHKVEASMPSRPTSDITNEIDGAKSIVDEKVQLKSIVRTEDHQKGKLKTEPKPQLTEPIEVVVQTPEVPPVAEILPVIEQRPVLLKSNVASTASKRRFKVVHENELRAEEETRPKLYPAENFVRIGMGRQPESTSDGNRPALTLPLTHKPNQ